MLLQQGKAPLNAPRTEVITTAAALSLLGPFSLPPGLYAPPLRGSDASMEGELTIRRSGDPSLTTADLRELADDLALLGVRKLSGGLVIDDTTSTPRRTPPAFEQKNE